MPTKHEINRSFLSQLNEPERSEALENYDEAHADNFKPAKSVREALAFSFYWRESKQGFTYWVGIDDKIIDNTYPFKTKTNHTMPKHEVILNSKQPKLMTISDAPNGCYLEANGLFFIKTISGCLVKLNDCNDSAILNPTALCRILETGESITINIK